MIRARSQASSSSHSTGAPRSQPKQSVLAANIARTELLIPCGPQWDSPNLKRPDFNSMRDRKGWGEMRIKINLDQEDLMLGTTALICALASIAAIFIDH